VFGPLFAHRVLAGFDGRQFRFLAPEEILGILQSIGRLALEITAFLGKQLPRFLPERGAYSSANPVPTSAPMANAAR
jgi:hypothetical protein